MSNDVDLQFPSLPATRHTVKARMLLTCPLVTVLLCNSASPSFASDLWATDSGGRPAIDLHQISITTGAVTSTKTVASGLASASLDDLASDPEREPYVIWGVRWSAFVNQLVAIDPFQNTILSSIQLTAPTAIHSLAIDPTTGVLYGAGGTSLFQIARDTGNTTFVGSAVTSLDRALGFDAAGNLYGIASNNALLAVDKFSGASSVVATLSTSPADIAASPDTGIMYGIGPGSPSYTLFQINLTSGASTTVGPSLSRPSSLAFTRSSPIGDFSGDTFVDARDYIMWRKGLGIAYAQSDYDTWRSHFGQPPGSGSSSAAGIQAAVPEPASAWLLIVGTVVATWRGRRIASRMPSSR